MLKMFTKLLLMLLVSLTGTYSWSQSENTPSKSKVCFSEQELKGLVDFRNKCEVAILDNQSYSDRLREALKTPDGKMELWQEKSVIIPGAIILAVSFFLIGMSVR